MSNLTYLPQVGSTNVWCKQNAEALSDGDAVYSTSQTQGRGRLGRSWQNAPGSGLYYSVLLKGPMADRQSLPLAASLGVSRALQQTFGAETQIKWPNDLLLKGKKLVGILCEGTAQGIVCGIGVNLSQPDEFWQQVGLPYATSLKGGLGIDPGPQGAERLARAISAQLAPGGWLEAFRRQGFAAIRSEYKAACVNLGRTVTFEGGSGLALDVDEAGCLVVETAQGAKQVFTGEVSVGGIYGSL